MNLIIVLDYFVYIYKNELKEEKKLTQVGDHLKSTSFLTLV
jgi:hypothetical protein